MVRIIEGLVFNIVMYIHPRNGSSYSQQQVVFMEVVVGNASMDEGEERLWSSETTYMSIYTRPFYIIGCLQVRAM